MMVKLSVRVAAARERHGGICEAARPALSIKIYSKKGGEMDGS